MITDQSTVVFKSRSTSY